jgi:hypothetical protein
MSQKMKMCLAVLGVLLTVAPATAEICTIDDVPAATLLLPYFEVDLNDANGVTTLFSVNNASASATIAHVTFWTDESVPTLDFDIYLTGYDLQTINVRDIFNGILPRTADAGEDPGDSISPQGALSQDINFPGSSGPCGQIYSAPPTATLSTAIINHIRASHTGEFSAVYGGCLGSNYGDNIARGYVTVDVANQCNLEFPNSAGYFIDGGGGLAGNRNILWGDYFYVDTENNYAQGETLVHVEACNFPVVGHGAGRCPFAPGDYTFYGRYVAADGSDGREPLSTTFATRYIQGGLFDGGTELVVWRDSKTDTSSTHACGSAFAWVPLNQSDAVAFDEQEQPEDLCFRGDNVSPPVGGSDTCFPLETQKVSLESSIVPFGATPAVSSPFGWLYLNLNTNTAGAGGIAAYGDTAQAWVTTVMSALGRFSVGFDAVQLDTACDTVPGGGVILIP